MTIGEITERGAETIRMPEGNGYAIAIWDETYPDRIVRHAALMSVDATDTDDILYEHTEVIWRAAAPA